MGIQKIIFEKIIFGGIEKWLTQRAQETDNRGKKPIKNQRRIYDKYKQLKKEIAW